ncbi:MAG: hypothetical protein R3D45_00575 [Rhizobiaceae bacterium]
MRNSAIARIALCGCIATLVATGYGTTVATAANVDYCHNYRVTGKQASAGKLSKARQRARDKWSSKAVSVKGSRWGDWSIALDKEYICSRAGLYYCKAKAAPCLYRKSRETKPAYPGATKPIN